MAEFGTFASGSVLTAAELNAAGAWTSFTPSWTNLTPGNGVVSAAYSKFNKILFVRVKFTWGTTTSCGDPVRMTLPASLTQETTSQDPIGLSSLTDIGVAGYSGVVSVISSTLVGINVYNAAGTYLAPNTVNTTRPFTWGNGDIISFQFTTRLA